MNGIRSAPGSEQFALAVDLGTSGLKVGLVSLTGAVAWHEHVPLSTEVDGDAATQDAELWWELVRDCRPSGLSSGTVPPAQVVAVCVTGQWACTVPVDDRGRPVGPCLLWMDTRGAPYSREVIGGPVVAGYAAGGPFDLDPAVRRAPRPPRGPTPSATCASCRPRKARARQGPGGPVVPRAGRLPVHALHRAPAASHASMVGAWLTDNRHLDVLEYDPVLVGRSGVDPRRLPPLHRTGSVIGTVLPEVAAELGLPGRGPGGHRECPTSTRRRAGPAAVL